MNDKAIKPQDFLDMDMGDLIDWIEKNGRDFALVPRELTVEMRHAFHDSIHKHKQGNEMEGTPDDQWDAMIKCWETRKIDNKKLLEGV